MVGLKQMIDWYNQNSEYYARRVRNYVPFARINDFVSLLPKKAVVLDAGSGSGRDTNALSQKGITAMGIDLSSELVKLAKKMYPALEFLEGNFLKLPFTARKFDGIWANASLIHLESEKDVKKALKEFNRVLKVGGIIDIIVKANLDNQKFEIVKDKISNVGRFFQYFTKDELSNLVKKAGFSIIKLYQQRDKNSAQKYFQSVEWIICLARKE